MSTRKRRQPPAQMQNVFIFLLLAIFAICAIFLTALSAQVYRNTVETSQHNNTARVVSSILRGAAQSEDAATASILEENGLPVLVFTNDYDGDIYLRRLYCVEGYLRESFTPAERPFEAEAGEALLEVTSFLPELKGHLLSARISTPDGVETEVQVYLRAGGATE